jgi:hypothetical protein
LLVLNLFTAAWWWRRLIKDLAREAGVATDASPEKKADANDSDDCIIMS